MPRLPDPAAIERRTPTTGVHRITVPHRRGVDPGLTGVGEALFAAGISLQRAEKEREARQARLQLAIAEADLSTSLINNERSSTSDDDYKSYMSRGSKANREALDGILQGIENPDARQLFAAKAQAKLAAADARLYALSMKGEQDAGRAQMNSSLDAIQDQLSQADMSRPGLINDLRAAAAEIYRTGRENKYITAEDAEASLRKFNAETAQTWLNRMSATQRLEVIRNRSENTWLDDMDPSTLASMERQSIKASKTERNTAAAYAAVDAVLAEHTSWEARYEAVEELPAEQRRLAEAQLGSLFNREQALDRAAYDDKVEAALDIGAREGSVSPELMGELKTRDRLLVQQAIAGKFQMDPEKVEAYDELRDQAVVTRGKNLLAMSPAEIRAAVPHARVDEVLRMRAAAAEAQITNQVKEVSLTDTQFNAIVTATHQMLNLGGAQTKLKSRRKGLLRFAFEDRKEALERSQDGPVTYEQMRQIQQQLVQEVTVDPPGAWNDTEKRVYELKMKELRDVVVPDDHRARIVKSHQKELGRNPTEEELLEAYLKTYGVELPETQ